MAINPLRDGQPGAGPDPHPKRHMGKAVILIAVLVLAFLALQYFGRSRTDVTPGGTHVPEAANPPTLPPTGKSPTSGWSPAPHEGRIWS